MFATPMMMKQSASGPHPLAGIYSGATGGFWNFRNLLSTGWQDTGKTTPISATGQGVAAMDPDVGSGVLLQGTSLSRPISAQTSSKWHVTCDGINDFWSLALDLSADDVVTVFGVSKRNTDSGSLIIAEFTTSSTTQAGSWGLFSPYSGSGTFNMRSQGTSAPTHRNSQVSATLGTDRYFVGRAEITTANVLMRVDGSDGTADTSGQGSGNYANSTLYIGMRAGSSLPFSGAMMAVGVIGKYLTGTDLTTLETYISGLRT